MAIADKATVQNQGSLISVIFLATGVIMGIVSFVQTFWLSNASINLATRFR